MYKPSENEGESWGIESGRSEIGGGDSVFDLFGLPYCFLATQVSFCFDFPRRSPFNISPLRRPVSANLWRPQVVHKYPRSKCKKPKITIIAAPCEDILWSLLSRWLLVSPEGIPIDSTHTATHRNPAHIWNGTILRKDRIPKFGFPNFLKIVNNNGSKDARQRIKSGPPKKSCTTLSLKLCRC